MSHQSTLTWSQGPGMDERNPVYLDDFMQGNMWHILFKDADHEHFFSDGLRGFQNFVMTDFICLEHEEEIIATKYVPKLQAALEVTRASAVNAQSAIDLLHTCMDSYADQRAAAQTAAQKITTAKKDDPALMAKRKQIADQWSAAELAKIEVKRRDLEERAVAATDGAGLQLRRFFQHIEKVGAFSAAFLERLEVWRELDAGQKTARAVIQDRRDAKLPEPRSMEETYKHIEQLDTLLDVDAAELCGCGEAFNEESFQEKKNPDSELDHSEPDKSTQEEPIPKDKNPDSSELGPKAPKESTKEGENPDSELGHSEPDKSIQEDIYMALDNEDLAEDSDLGPSEPVKSILEGTVVGSGLGPSEPEKSILEGTVAGSDLGASEPDKEEPIPEDKNPDSSESKAPEESIHEDVLLGHSEADKSTQEELIPKDKNPDSSRLGHDSQASEAMVESGGPVDEDGYECISDTESVVALEDSLLEHSLSKLMLKDSLSLYISISLSLSPSVSLSLSLFLTYSI